MARNKKAPGSFERRGDTIRWRVCVGGTYHRFTFKTTDRKEAERAARAEYERLDGDQLRRDDGLPTGKTLGNLIEYFETHRLPRLAPGTQRSYKDSLKPIKEYFGADRFAAIPLDRIRSGHIQEYMDWRATHRRDGDDGALHLRTLSKDRSVLHRLFTVAYTLEWCETNPVKRIEVESPDARAKVILSSEQYEKLLEKCTDQMVKLYVLVLGEAGARCESEATWIRWEDVDFDGGFLSIVTGRDGHRTKGGKTRSVPMTPRLTLALRAHFAKYRFAAYDGTRPEYVFHHTQSRRGAKAGERVVSFRHSVDGAAVKAKLPTEWTMHQLRHRRVTTWLGEGQSAAIVQEALGHSDIQTTMGYKHLAKEHLRQLVEPGQKSGQILGISGAQ